MSRVLERPATEFDAVEDYEAVGSPVFAWRDAVARDGRTSAALSGVATAVIWRALGGGSEQDSSRDGGVGGSLVASLRRRALGAGFPLAVAALNRAGLGPVRADISPGELRRAGLAAMAEVAARLGLGDAYVVFGHTHRSGPLPGDREPEWLGRSGARLVNAGSWTYSPIFLTSTPGESPYWPGGCVLVEDSGPPEVRGLLSDRTHAELRTPPARGGHPPARGGNPPARGGHPAASGGHPAASGGHPAASGGHPPARGGYPPARGGYPMEPTISS
jgi:hypothetical protein